MFCKETCFRNVTNVLQFRGLIYNPHHIKPTKYTHICVHINAHTHTYMCVNIKNKAIIIHRFHYVGYKTKYGSNITHTNKELKRYDISCIISSRICNVTSKRLLFTTV